MDAEAPISVVMAWYQDLPKGAREKLSLHNLHTLAKALAAWNRRTPDTSPSPEGLEAEDISGEFLDYCIDYDEAYIPDDHEPRRIPTCGQLREAAALIRSLTETVSGLNQRLIRAVDWGQELDERLEAALRRAPVQPEPSPEWRDPNSGEVYSAERLAELLEMRDVFIVNQGLWETFVAGLDTPSPTGREG